MRKQIKLFTIILLMGTLFVGSFLLCTQKPSIHSATISELESLEDIGEVLSKQIHLYVQVNDIRSVDELQGHIKYLGEVRLSELKKKYK